MDSIYTIYIVNSDDDATEKYLYAHVWVHVHVCICVLAFEGT